MDASGSNLGECSFVRSPRTSFWEVVVSATAPSARVLGSDPSQVVSHADVFHWVIKKSTTKQRIIEKKKQNSTTSELSFVVCWFGR